MPQLQAHSAQWQKWGPAVVDLSGDWRARLAARFPRKHMEIAEAMAPVEGANLTFAASHVGAEGRGTATTRWLLTMEQRVKPPRKARERCHLWRQHWKPILPMRVHTSENPV